MSTQINCPHCNHSFEPNEAIKKDLQNRMVEWKKEKEQEFQSKIQQREEEYARSLHDQKTRLVQEVAGQTRQQLQAEFDSQSQTLVLRLQQQEEKLNDARQEKLEFLKKEQELAAKEQELDIRLQKMLLEERTNLSQQIRREESERSQLRETEYQFKLKEMEMQLEAQRKLAEEMRRKAEQGSMQLQGEAQELVLEELLRSEFPFDLVEEVGKGVRGADCIQTVRNQYGQECGRIIFESKRTQAFGAEWIEKLKAEMRSTGAEVGVIVTKNMPRDMECFGEKDGVWICTFREAAALASLLRDLIIRVHKASLNQEHKGDKMTLLYNYLTGQEFNAQWKAIREGFLSMRMSLQRERDTMEKLWKMREKQLEKVLLNAAHISGSIEGISGMEHIHLDLEEPVQAQIE